MHRPAYVAWLEDVDKDDIASIGLKGAELAKAASFKLPILPTFVVTTSSYFDFLKHNNLEIKIRHNLASINFDDPASLIHASDYVRSLIISAEIPRKISKSMFDFYEFLKNRSKSLSLRILASPVHEGFKNSSLYDLESMYSQIRGESALVDCIRYFWSSNFEEDLLLKKHHSNLDQVNTPLSLLIQKSPETDLHGALYTIDPATFDKSALAIKVGDYLEEYIVNKKTRNTIKKQGGGKLRDNELGNLIDTAEKIEKYYYFPKIVQWVREKSNIFISDIKPINYIGRNEVKESKLTHNIKKSPLVKGAPLSPGIAIGPARIIKKSDDLKKINTGEVIIISPQLLNKHAIPHKISGLILVDQSKNIPSTHFPQKKIGPPCVLVSDNTLSELKQGTVITLNGSTGEVYEGVHLSSSRPDHILGHTKTKIYTCLSSLDISPKILFDNPDGVVFPSGGILKELGIHPKVLSRHKDKDKFLEKIVQRVKTTCEKLYPLPVFYPLFGLDTSELRKLEGGRIFEEVEANPMIGYRGVFRIINDPQMVMPEMKVLQKVREKDKISNIHVLIPFVRNSEELSEIKKILRSYNLHRGTRFKLFMKTDTPSHVIMLEDFIQEGIDGVFINLDVLGTFLLGTDGKNPDFAHVNPFTNPALLSSLQRIIQACEFHHIESILFGTELPFYPDSIEKLAQLGISGVAVSSLATTITKNAILESERA